MAAPTLTDYQQSNWGDTGSTPEATASLSWNADDLVVVIGITESQTATINTPTATGLTFSLLDSVAIASTCRLYVWTARAAGSGSSVISAVTDGATQMRGLSAWSYGNSAGVGATSKSTTAQTVSVRSLARTGPNSAVVFGLGDFTANADVTVTASPSSGGTVRVNATSSGRATMFTASWTDQGAAGTSDFGIASFAGVTTNTMIAIEILGTAEVALTGTVTATITEADIVAGGKTIILTVAGDTVVPATVVTAITQPASANGGTSSTTSFSITLPTTQADDILILEFCHRGTGDGTIGGTSVSVGGLTWALKHSQLFATSTFSGKLYWTRATGNHSGQTVTGSSLTNACAAIVKVKRGVVASGDPFTNAATIVGEQNASGNETQAEITTLVDGAEVNLTILNSPDLAVATHSCTSPGALNSEVEVLSTGGTDASISSACAVKASAGGTGSFTWTQTDAASGSYAYALQPATTTPFADARAAIASGLDSAQSEGGGWDAKVKPNIPVADVVRTSDTVITVTLQAQADYNITAQETITATVPATALVGADAVIATPTFTIDTGGGGGGDTSGRLLLGDLFDSGALFGRLIQ